ncbi:11022_t:CDS:2, partial [Acaulospora colombiana]
ALKATAGRGLQPAMDHILENEGKPIPDLSSTSANEPSAATADADEDEDMKLAQSLALGDQEAKESDLWCMRKHFLTNGAKNPGTISSKKIKPLTEEEKKQKLAELKEKMAAKRAAKSSAEEEERKANEALRRKAGKDTTQVRQEMKVKEALKEAEQRKKDKLDDAKARAEIKAQIEADKKARAEKAAKEKALREGQAPPPTASTSATPAAAAAPSVKKEYTETRLQVNIDPSFSTLRDVAEYVASQSLAYNVETVSFSTNFPRKNYSRDEWGQTLKELGLTPSAELVRPWAILCYKNRPPPYREGNKNEPMVNMGIEPRTSELLARRSNQLS